MKLLIVKKAVLTIFEKFKTIGNIPFFRKSAEFVTTGATAIEIRESFITATNSSLSIPHRVMGVTRGSCCTGALVTSYFATRTPNPGLAATFRICCAVFSAGYGLTGGDVKIASTFIFNSTRKG